MWVHRLCVICLLHWTVSSLRDGVLADPYIPWATAGELELNLQLVKSMHVGVIAGLLAWPISTLPPLWILPWVVLEHK